MTLVCETHSPSETESLGERIGCSLHPGDVVALFGDLGAGKTCMTRGIARGLGATGHVRSPSFVLLREYPVSGPTASFPLYHLDLYRLTDEGELEDIGGRDVLYGPGVCVVEWAERAEGLLPPDAIRVHLVVTGETSRRIRVAATSDRLARIERDLNAMKECRSA